MCSRLPGPTPPPCPLPLRPTSAGKKSLRVRLRRAASEKREVRKKVADPSRTLSPGLPALLVYTPWRPAGGWAGREGGGARVAGEPEGGLGPNVPACPVGTQAGGSNKVGAPALWVPPSAFAPPSLPPTLHRQLRLQVGGEGPLVHLLQADDVGVEAQQLRQHQRAAVVGVQKPARGSGGGGGGAAVHGEGC